MPLVGFVKTTFLDNHDYYYYFKEAGRDHVRWKDLPGGNDSLPKTLVFQSNPPEAVSARENKFCTSVRRSLCKLQRHTLTSLYVWGPGEEKSFTFLRLMSTAYLKPSQFKTMLSLLLQRNQRYLASLTHVRHVPSGLPSRSTQQNKCPISMFGGSCMSLHEVVLPLPVFPQLVASRTRRV